MDVYQMAWASLLKRIEAKTSWGRNELKQEMLEALVEAGNYMPPPFQGGIGETLEETNARLALANAEILRGRRG